MGSWWMPDNGTAATGIHDSDGKWLADAAYRCSADKLVAAHNADCDAYEDKIAALESRLDRIAALVKPVPVAELVEAGTEAPALLAERHRRIRAILEDEG